MSPRTLFLFLIIVVTIVVTYVFLSSVATMVTDTLSTLPEKLP